MQCFGPESGFLVFSDPDPASGSGSAKPLAFDDKNCKKLKVLILNYSFLFLSLYERLSSYTGEAFSLFNFYIPKNYYLYDI
jgi:hypothetical protein